MRLLIQLSAWLLLCLAPATICADGVIVDRVGEYIREDEQHAYIQWKDGKETLFVATRAESTSETTLWLLPFPAPPEQIKAEPVEEYPQVGRFIPVAENARNRIEREYQASVAISTGICLWQPIVFFAGAGRKSASDDAVEVHLHIEKLGMTVEVITTKSTDALDRYLAGKNFGVKAVNISALQPYLKKEFSLVCAWVNDPVKAEEARALRIDFPAPHVFFPLQPSRVYVSEIRTSILVEGHFQPKDGTSLKGLRCVYGLDKTKIELSPNPQDWTEDLYLEEGAPFWVNAVPYIWHYWFVLHGAAGLLVGALLPFVFIPNAVRRSKDWFFACFAGTFITFTIFVSALLFIAWMRQDHWRNGSLGAERLILCIVALSLVHVAAMSAVYFGIDSWLASLE